MNKYIQNSSVLKTSPKASLPRKEVICMLFFKLLIKNEQIKRNFLKFLSHSLSFEKLQKGVIVILIPMCAS